MITLIIGIFSLLQVILVVFYMSCSMQWFQVPEDTNILTDGCLIDLCGVTLMWRTAIGLEQGPVRLPVMFP